MRLNLHAALASMPAAHRFTNVWVIHHAPEAPFPFLLKWPPASISLSASFCRTLKESLKLLHTQKHSPETGFNSVPGNTRNSGSNWFTTSVAAECADSFWTATECWKLSLDNLHRSLQGHWVFLKGEDQLSRDACVPVTSLAVYDFYLVLVDFGTL